MHQRKVKPAESAPRTFRIRPERVDEIRTTYYLTPESAAQVIDWMKNPPAPTEALRKLLAPQ